MRSLIEWAAALTGLLAFGASRSKADHTPHASPCPHPILNFITIHHIYIAILRSKKNVGKKRKIVCVVCTLSMGMQVEVLCVCSENEKF